MNPDAQKMNERSLSRRLPALAASSLCLALALSGCGSSHSYATSAGGSTDFSSVVFIGDSLTAGYQNGSLLDSQQPHGYARPTSSSRSRSSLLRAHLPCWS